MGLWCLLLLYITCQCTFGEYLIHEAYTKAPSIAGENEAEDFSLPDESYQTGNQRKRSAELQWQYPSSARNIKKNPKFSSWGGKRSPEDCSDPEQCDDLPYFWEKRARFNSWGGKRAPSRFNSWGGKRDWIPIRDERGKFASWGGKRDDEELFRDERGKFASWGGKRAEDDPILIETRGRFSSWGGKRGAEDDDPEEEKRGKFASWGGKRSDDDENCTVNCDNELAPDLDKRSSFFLLKGGHSSFPKGWKRRPLFSSWGGKRTESPPLNIYDYIRLMEFLRQHEIEENADKKEKEKEQEQEPEEIVQQKRDGGESGKRRPGFSSWGGKRAKFASWGGKRAVFSSWGKRRNINFQQLIQSLQSAIGKRYPLYKVRDGKRIIPFSSWGGKRSDPEAHIRKRSLNTDEFNNAFPLAYKRSPLNKYLINRYYLINSVLKDGQWTSVLRPIRRGSDFYPWGGKRST